MPDPHEYHFRPMGDPGDDQQPSKVDQAIIVGIIVVAILTAWCILIWSIASMVVGVNEG